jgi:hypothetical protein
MSFSEVFQVLSSLPTPLNQLRVALRRYKENKKIKQEVADAFETEAKEFEDISNRLGIAGDVTLNLIKEIKEQPTPMQLFDFMDVMSLMPKILAELLISFIHIAKACKEISKEKGFMDSLRSTDHYTHDFIELMGSAYIGKNTIKIDGSFFRFYRVHKSEITKHMKKPKISKKELEILQKNIDLLLQSMTFEFAKRHTRHALIKKWQNSFIPLTKAAKDIKVEDIDYSILKDFIPPELQEFAPFFDKSP